MPRTQRKRRRRSKKLQAEVDLSELQTIVNATAERVLTDEEQKKLQDSHQLLADLILPQFLNDETAAAVLGENIDPDREREQKKRKSPEKGHGRRKRDDFKNAKVVKVSHPGMEPGQACDCGCGKFYKWNRSGQFRHFVGRTPIEVTIYELEQFKCNICDKVVTAPLPEGVGPDSYDATAASTIALNKYGLGLPFYRQARQLMVQGVPIAASTQYKVVAEALEKMMPVYEHLLDLAAQGKLAYFDDTSMKILDYVRSKGDDRTGLFTTGLVSVHDQFEIALLFTGRNHAGENRAELLKRRDPSLPEMILMSDALAANMVDIKAEDILANCLAHGRRNFVKVVDSFPDECKIVIEAIGTIFHNDNLSKEQGHSPEERLDFHQEHSGPVMAELRNWLDNQLKEKKTEPNSSLGKAIKYLRRHWSRLTLFLRVPGAPVDNNVAERLLKSVVLHRKNSLFYRTARGAKTGDVYMTLIQTCQRNDVNPWDYLTALQRHFEETKVSPEEWLPWNYSSTVERLRGSPPQPEGVPEPQTA